MPTLDVPPPVPASGTFTPGSARAAIKRPNELTWFSLDLDRQYHYDDSSIRFYYTPKLDSSLGEGLDTFRRWDDSKDEHLVFLLKCLEDYEREIGERVKMDLVMWRGMLTKVMTAPYITDEGFDFLATKFQDTIYMEQNHEVISASKAESTVPPVMTYSGYKFEALATIPDTWGNVTREQIEQRHLDVVDNISQYVSVCTSRIGDISFIIGGEVDAIDRYKPIEKEHRREQYIELKTAAAPRPHNRDRFQMRLLKFWAQSFLLGVPAIIVGYRDMVRGEPILRRTVQYRTTDIPRMVREDFSNAWRSDVCLSFLSTFLRFVKDNVQGDGVFRIHLPGMQPGSTKRSVGITRVAESGHGRILTPEWISWRGGEPTQDDPHGSSSVPDTHVASPEMEDRPETPPSC